MPDNYVPISDENELTYDGGLNGLEKGVIIGGAILEAALLCAGGYLLYTKYRAPRAPNYNVTVLTELSEDGYPMISVEFNGDVVDFNSFSKKMFGASPITCSYNPETNMCTGLVPLY